MSNFESEEMVEGSETELETIQPDSCAGSYSTTEIWEYLIRAKWGVPSSGDLEFGEHIAACEACQQAVEELQTFDDAVRLPKEELIQVAEAVIHDEAGKTESSEMWERFDEVADRFVSGIQGARELKGLNDEMRRTSIQIKEHLGRVTPAECEAYKDSLKDKIARDPDLCSQLEEIAVCAWATCRPQSLLDFPVAKEHPEEVVKAFLSSKSGVDSLRFDQDLPIIEPPRSCTTAA